MNMASDERASLLPRAGRFEISASATAGAAGGGRRSFGSAVGPGGPCRRGVAGGIADLDRVHDDPPSHRTLARRIAGHLARLQWYRPAGAVGGEDDGAGGSGARAAVSSPSTSSLPSLDAAWAYYEHFVLPRHFARPDEGGSRGGVGRSPKDELQRAEPGESERETRLYDVWGTPEKDLADMGVGVGIYFFTVRCLAGVLLLAGLLNIPSCLYYSSEAYKHDTEAAGQLPYVLQASAVCTDHEWAACPSCTKEQWDYFPRTFDRYAEAATGDEGGQLTFIKVNNCRLGYVPGLWNWISLVVVSVALYYVCFHVIKRRELDYDEAMQTSSDYSLAVENPPKDARDARKWREFFSRFGHVTALTVALDNADLARALVARRCLLHALETLLPPGAAFDKFDPGSAAEVARPVPRWQEAAGLCCGAAKLLEKIKGLDEKIGGMAEQQYEVAEIFVTFETEVAQRKALRELRVGRWDTVFNNKNALPEHLLYEGKHLLNVLEAPEPSAVRWQDLNDSLARRLFVRFVTASATGVLILCGMLLIARVRLAHGPALAALAISALNAAVPQACYALTECESHRSEGAKQASRYLKMTLAMLFFSTLVTAFVTPFTDTASDGTDSILYSVFAIFVVDELVAGPLVQVLDIPGNAQRHVLGPRATNHIQLTALFKGTEYELSDRYTNMTNVLFLTFYYGTIFPAGYFFAALALTVHYWADKYCLLRVWGQAPKIGTSISSFGRSFTVASLLVLAVLSSYYVASFPFDNACEGTDSVPSEYVGEFAAKTGDSLDVSISIEENDRSFFFCDMDMQRYLPVTAFPAWASNQPTGGEWMDGDQKKIAWLFVWTSVLGVVCCVWIFFRRVVLKFLRDTFFGGYDAEGTPSDVTFSSVLETSEIFAYVPQVRVPNLPMPLLVCNVDAIDRELIGWNDPHNGVSAHNVLLDIPGLDQKKVFSEVYHWSPLGKK